MNLLWRANAGLLALRDRMTPGQRWTSSLALALSVVVLLFGMPTRQVVVPGAVQAASGPRAPSRTPAAPDPAYTGAFVALDADEAVVEMTTEPVVVPDPPPAADPPMARSVAALVGPAGSDGRLPGRSEADVARTFVAQAALPIPLHEVTDDADACDQATSATIVIAGEGLSDDLLGCLRETGVTVIAFHPLGGDVLPTRRGFGDTLLDLGAWGVASGALEGSVGVVASPEREAAVRALEPTLRALGVEVTATAFVASAGDVSDGVLSFQAAGVEAVLFAVPVGWQRQWGPQHRMLDVGVRLVVSDVADGVQEERYPPSFEGALAHTSLRVPWYEREHGETAEQELCRTTWESAAPGGQILDATERRWVFSWCQHVALATALVRAETGSIEETLSDLQLPSPLTSDLGPLPDGGWGPTADAVLSWSAACACWTEQRGFAPRRP